MASLSFIVLSLALICCGVEATNIAVFGTGLTAEGELLAVGAVDANYQVNGGSAYVVSNVPTSYSAGTSSSQWIGLNADFTQNVASGYTSYETNFDLTGVDPTSASLTGFVSSDDTVEIFLNEISVGQGCSNGCTSSRTAFTITSGFRHGLNVLSFKVGNSNPSPSGLQVSVSGIAYTAEEFCANSNRNNWNDGEGLYCWNGGKGFLTCFGDSGNTFVTYKRCLSGSCRCPFGTECTDEGTSVPCY